MALTAHYYVSGLSGSKNILIQSKMLQIVATKVYTPGSGLDILAKSSEGSQWVYKLENRSSLFKQVKTGLSRLRKKNWSVNGQKSKDQ